MSEPIKKPIPVANEDFKKGLAELCNNSGLPWFCIADTLTNFAQQVKIAAIEQYEKDKSEYEKAIKKKSDKEI